MKKYFGLLFCLAVLNACDDGDMNSQSFNFDSTEVASSCPQPTTINTVFKINNNEALILKIDGPQTFTTPEGVEYTINLFPFRNQVTQTGVPKIYKVNAANRVIYRVFNGTVTSSYFCQQIPPVSPSVVSESSTSNDGNGRIEITTSKIVSDYASVSAIKYQHSVVLKDISFSDGVSNTTYETFNYGIYEKNSGVNFSFPTTGSIIKCPDGGRLFRIADTNIGNDSTKENLNEVLEFKITDDQLAALENGDNPPMYINETNQLIYKIYSSDVISANALNPFLCSGIDDTLIPTPVAYETFIANNGVPDNGTNDATGVFEIRKVPNTLVPGQPQTYNYAITFRNVTFKDQSGNTTFKQNSFIFGNYTLDR